MPTTQAGLGRFAIHSANPLVERGPSIPERLPPANRYATSPGNAIPSRGKRGLRRGCRNSDTEARASNLERVVTGSRTAWR